MLILAAVLLANAASMLGYSGLTVALVRIGSDLGADESLILVLPIAFLGAVAAATPITPWLLARLGARRLLLLALVGLVLASLAAAASPGFGALIAAVVAQGLC